MIRFTLLMLSLLLGACSSLRDPNAPAAPVEELGTRPSTAAPPQSTALPPTTPQVVTPPLRREPLPGSTGSTAPAPGDPASALLAEADQAIAGNELERAAALCERGLRISPRNGQLWYKLASIRYLQGRYQEARGFAQRAQSFAAGDPGLARDSAALLARLDAALAE